MREKKEINQREFVRKYRFHMYVNRHIGDAQFYAKLLINYADLRCEELYSFSFHQWMGSETKGIFGQSIMMMTNKCISIS